MSALAGSFQRFQIAVCPLSLVHSQTHTSGLTCWRFSPGLISPVLWFFAIIIGVRWELSVVLGKASSNLLDQILTRIDAKGWSSMLTASFAGGLNSLQMKMLDRGCKSMPVAEFGSEDRCSIQLSYGRPLYFQLFTTTGARGRSAIVTIFFLPLARATA